MAFFQDSVCSICEARNVKSEAVNWCSECEEALCNSCLDHHTISKATKTHKTFSIGDYKALPSYILAIHLSCKEHDEKYQLYCHNHNVPLCPKCLISNHRECKEVKTLDEVIHNVKSSVAMETLEKGLETTLTNFQAIIDEKSDNLHKIKEQRHDIKLKVHSAREELNRHLDLVEENILEKLSNDADKIEKRLDGFINDMKAKENQTRQLRQDVKNVISYASDLQVFLGMTKLETMALEKSTLLENIHASSILNNITMECQPGKIMENLELNIPPFIKISTDESSTEVVIHKQDINQAQMIKPAVEIRLNRNNDKPDTRDTYRALYDYDTNNEDELTFKKGDIFIAIDKTNQERWFVRKIDFEAQIYPEGFVPHAFVQNENPLYSYEWFFGKMSAKEAENLLLKDWNDVGSYLLTCDDEQKVYILSVLYLKSQSKTVLHHEIAMLRDGTFEVSFSNTKLQFSKLPDVICHLTQSTNRLCQKLVKPCKRSMINWEIPRKSLELMTKVQDWGHYKEVWKGKWNEKMHVRISRYQAEPEAEMTSELDILKLCQHDHIIQLFGVCSDVCYIVTQLAFKGNLLDYLRSNEEMKYKFADLVEIAAQVANALAYLESHNIIHRDVAARNIFLTHHRVAKLGNFTLGQVLEDGEFNPKHGTKFPIKWTAPEAAFYGKFTSKSEVWSFGIFLVELLTYGKIPYEGMLNREILEKVERGFRHPKPTGCPDSMYNIMLNCWNKDPSKRPTFEYLFSTMDDYFVSTEPFYDEVENCIS